MNQDNKVLLCIDNIAGCEVLKYLIERPHVEIVAVIIHAQHNTTHLDEITKLCLGSNIPIIDILDARNRFDALIAPLKPDFLVSIYFDYILDDRFITLPTKDAINLHPGYLPYNKGFYYYAWAVLDGTPAGVSIHRIVSEVDAGPVISQKRVLIEASDTGETIYAKHMHASVELFQMTWPSIAASSYQVFPQLHRGTRKKISETNQMLEIDPYATYVARDLINILRVFSFSGSGGCMMQIDGKKYNIGIALSEVVENLNRTQGKRDNYLVGSQTMHSTYIPNKQELT